MRLESYEPIVGPQVLEELRVLAARLEGKRVLNVNSTAIGGGVAEILSRMVPLMNELGVVTRWECIEGGEAFYAVTKKIHNALHGDTAALDDNDFDLFLEVQNENLKRMSLDEEIVFVHDPQPVGLVQKKKFLKNKWLWRCHIDVSAPAPRVWEFIEPFVTQYDRAVFSSRTFSKHLPVPQVFICPSIDPLSDKNRPMAEEEIKAIMDRLRIPMDKPLVTQVSRFDRLKDPVGVIAAFKKMESRADARLLLVGGTATDDPEGAEVLKEVREAAGDDADILVLLLPPTSHTEINAIQRASTIILQKSLKEGFGLTITEALWKGKPVIAGAVGGIPLQIAHRRTGILTRSVDETAYWLNRLLQEPGFAKKLGENGREHVRRHFLLTRHMRDYLLLFLSLDYSGAEVAEFLKKGR